MANVLTGLSPTPLQAYTTSAAYSVGQLVTAPDGSIQTPKAGIASAPATFNPLSWTAVSEGIAAADRVPPPPVARTPISLLQAGHGWTKSTGGGTVSDDTSNFVIGTQSLKLVTDGAGATCVMDSGALGAPVDLSNKLIRITFQVTNFAAYNSIAFYCGDSALANYNFVILPNLTGQTIWNHDGEWVTMIFHPSDFTVGAGTLNWAAVQRLRLRANDASNGQLTINLNEVSYHPQPTTNGTVSLEFDDGYLGTATKAAPILAQYGMPANVWIIRDFIDTLNPAFMTVQQLRNLQDFNRWEIGAHASTGTNHNNWATVTDAQAEDEFQQIKSWLIRNGFRGHDHHVWPEGQFTESKMRILRRYFSTSRSIFSGTGTTLENWPVADWTRCRAYLPAQTTTVATINALIDQAVARKQWLRLVFHNITDSPSAGTDYLTSNLASVVAHLASSGAQVRTVGDIFARGIA